MGKFILDFVDIITTLGRKMTVTIVTTVCFTVLGCMEILVLNKLSDVLLYVMGACVMAFFGFNVWAYFSPNVNTKDDSINTPKVEK